VTTFVDRGGRSLFFDYVDLKATTRYIFFCDRLRNDEVGGGTREKESTSII
jgi:hypothetical protein